MAASPDTKMKVVMLGKEATGKTSLVERFLSGRFQGEGQVKSTIAGAYGGRYLLLASVSEQYADTFQEAIHRRPVRAARGVGHGGQ